MVHKNVARSGPVPEASLLGRTSSSVFALSAPPQHYYSDSHRCSLLRPAARRAHSYSYDSGSSFLDLDSPSPVTPSSFASHHYQHYHYQYTMSLSTPQLAGHGYSESFGAQVKPHPPTAAYPALDRPRTTSSSRSSGPLGPPPSARPSTADCATPSSSHWNTVREWSCATMKAQRVVARPKGPRPLPPTPCPAFCGMPFAFDNRKARKTTVVPAPLPSPTTSVASKPHPNQVGARRLSLNTIKKLSARPLASPTLPLDGAPRCSIRPSAHGFLLDLPSPCPSAASSELHNVPELSADEGTSSAAEWEDDADEDDKIATPGDETASELASMYSGEGTAIVCKAFRAPATCPTFLAPPPPPSPAATPRKKRPTPPPLTLTLVTPGTFLLSDPSPASAVSPSVYTARARKRRSQASRRRASRRASTITAGTRDSVISSGSLFPTFAAATPRQSAVPSAAGEEEPASPHLMHPLHQRLAGKARARAANATLHQLTHAIEPGRNPKTPSDGSKARRRLGLDANDNVVEIAEGDDLSPKLRPGFLDAQLTKPVALKKKSTFSVRRFFTIRR